MASKQDTQETPRVWIGSLAAYNDGRLIGEWTDADDLETLEEVAERVVAKGGGEEFALFDFEGFGKLIGEYTPLDAVAELGAALAEHGDAFMAYLETMGYDEAGDVPVDEFEEAFCGEWDSLQDYAEELASDIGAVTGREMWPLNCIDWERAAHELAYDYTYVSGFVFRVA